MSSQEFEQKLQQQIADLPKAIEPGKDLWAGIDIALTMKDSKGGATRQFADAAGGQANNASNVVSWDFTRSPKMLALAASFVAVAALSWNWLQPTPNHNQTLQLVEAMTQQHAAQKGALLVSMAEAQPLAENWQQQLKDLEAAAIAIRTALEQEPENVALLKMLQQVHQQQIELIERVHSPQWDRV